MRCAGVVLSATYPLVTPSVPLPTPEYIVWRFSLEDTMRNEPQKGSLTKLEHHFSQTDTYRLLRTKDTGCRQVC